MIDTRASSLFGLIALLAMGCAPSPDAVEQSQSALLDDDVVNYVPTDRSLEALDMEALPDVMGAPADILAIAVAEEGKTLEEVGVSTGFPLSTYAGAAPGGWCSEFVAWSYWRGGCPFTGQRGTYPWMIGGSTQIRQWFLTNSRFVYQTSAEWETYEPQPGDYIRYNNPEGGHSGIVRYAEGTTLYTVEGNVNSKVMLRTLRNYKTAYSDPEDGIDGFGVMTDAQCGSTNGAGGAAGTGGSAGAGGTAGSAGTTGTGNSAGTGGAGAAGGSASTGGAAGTAGSGGSAGAGGAAGSGSGDGGRSGAGGAASTGGSSGRRGRGGATGADAGTGGRGVTAGTTSSSAGGDAGASGVGGVADPGGAGARGGAGGGAGRSGSTSPASSAGGSGGGAGAGGASSRASTSTSAGGNDSTNAQASSNGCSCSVGQGSDVRHGVWLTVLAFLFAARRRKRR